MPKAGQQPLDTVAALRALRREGELIDESYGI